MKKKINSCVINLIMIFMSWKYVVNEKKKLISMCKKYMVYIHYFILVLYTCLGIKFCEYDIF